MTSRSPASDSDHKQSSIFSLKGHYAYSIIITPIVAVFAAVLAYSLHVYFQGAYKLQPAPEGLTLLKVFKSLAIVAVAYFCSLLLIFGRALLLEALLSLSASICICLAIVVAIEHFLRLNVPVPPTYIKSADRYSTIQMNLQRLLERRNKHDTRLFRGVEHTRLFNDYGWPDLDRSLSTHKPRILFIGDSFLEVRSSLNLALRVEERLHAMGHEVEIINLSQGNTSPLDYRYRLQEFGLNYHPDHVVIFLYAGNDFSRLFKYKPYQAAPFSITKEAITIIKATNRFSSTTIETLQQLQDRGINFNSQLDFFTVVEDLLPRIEDRLFIYQVVFAFSTNELESADTWFASLTPHTLSHLTRIWERIFPPISSFAPTSADADLRLSWQDLQEPFKRLLSQPKQQRLEGLARLAARFNGQDDIEPFIQPLTQLDDYWFSELFAEPDVTYFVWPAITKLALDEPKFSAPNSDQLQTVANEYLLLFEEYRKISNDRVIDISFVLIPEASEIDQGFYEFWQPLIDFRQRQAFENGINKLMADQLPEIASTINLSDFSNQFENSYWPIDGHWNEKGNQVAAGILSDYLSDKLSDRNSK